MSLSTASNEENVMSINIHKPLLKCNNSRAVPRGQPGCLRTTLDCPFNCGRNARGRPVTRAEEICHSRGRCRACALQRGRQRDGRAPFAKDQRSAQRQRPLAIGIGNLSHHALHHLLIGHRVEFPCRADDCGQELAAARIPPPDRRTVEGPLDSSADVPHDLVADGMSITPEVNGDDG